VSVSVTIRPSAHGSLAKTPFAHLLLYMQSRKLTGTLAIWAAETEAAGQDRILFEDGKLVAMRPLVAAKTLYSALLPLFARKQAPYGFYEGHNLLGSRGSLLQEPIDLYTLLSRGLRTHTNEAVMDAMLERVRGRELRLRSGTPTDRLELNARELSLIEPLTREGATVDALLGGGVMPPRDVKRTLYLLTLVRALESVGSHSSIPAPMESFPPQRASSEPVSTYTLTGVKPPRESVPVSRDAFMDEAREVSGSQGESASPSAPPAPLGLPERDQGRWNELVNLYAKLDEVTHYDLLNVPKGAPRTDIQAAYYGLVKRFHPDRLPLALAPLARVAQMLFDRLTEANTVLGDEKARAMYDEAVAGGGGTRAADRAMRHVLESTLEFQKAEVLARRRDYPQAMQLLRSALGKNPDDPDYHALHAWLLHLMNPSTPAPFDEMLRSLDRALKLNPRHERAHYYKGVVLKRLNRNGEAVKHFRAAAEINPHNVDAAREVRLAIMRRESKPPASGQGGVLSRLFKK
jgi:curved DNA-binding protein CbpA